MFFCANSLFSGSIQEKFENLVLFASIRIWIGEDENQQRIANLGMHLLPTTDTDAGTMK